MSNTELPKAYRPAEHEDRIRGRWMDARAFSADPQRVLSGQAKPFSILIPPPNVTARLHLGHALNNTLQDVLTRAHRMMGFEAMWMPGTDHAGIATQAVVERRLREEGTLKGPLKDAFSREDFVAKVQAWKDDYEKQITDQLKLMGCSCDFDRQRFTMDDICAKAVREAFFRLFRDGLIYRGKRLVNWDPQLQTAVADDECFEDEIDTSFWYLRYPLVKVTSGQDAMPVTWDELAARGYPGANEQPGDQQAWVTVATTRPETYLADTAVAVNPHDPRANALRGLSVELPLVGRVIPIVEDAYVVLPEALARNEEEKNDPKAKYATGFLKVTPGHDKNDYELGLRHNLAIINMMSPDGRVSDKHGWTDVGSAHLFVGLTMAEARKKVVAEFKSHGLMEAIKPYRQAITVSDRSKAQVEPYLSDQWYVRVTDPRMAQTANAALVPQQRSGGASALSGSASGSAFGGTALQSGVRGAAPTSATLDDLNLDTLPVASFEGRDPYPPGERSPRDLSRWIRNLPHIELPGATYFVTWTVASGTLSESERSLVLESIRHGDGETIELLAACVMPDHIHAIVKPFGGLSLGDWVGGVKKFTARRINAARGSEGQLWQDERFDHIIRDHAYLAQFVWYVVNNPVEAGLAASPSRYGFTYASAEVLSAAERRFSKVAPTRRSTALESSATQSQKSPDGDGSMAFFPARYAKTFEHWHDNIRDWCISRQLWWGHRIPVWSRRCDFTDPAAKDAEGFTLSARLSSTDIDEMFDDPHCCVHFVDAATGDRLHPAKSADPFAAFAGKVVNVHVCIREDGWNPKFVDHLENWGGFARDPDVLDTWFSSALWPLSTMGWPEPEQAATAGLLKAYNPTSVLCTAREIITLWVSRMTMFNRYFRSHEAATASSAASSGPVPFKHVYIHAVVQDGEGQKMSKSLGNGVDPLDIIETHGSDAMRFALAQLATQTQDVRLPVDILDPHTGEAFTAKMVQHGTARVAAPIQEYKGKKMVSSFGLASGQAKPTPEMPLARNTSSRFDFGRNFANKMWNASRFTLAILDKAKEEQATKPAGTGARTLPDRWILSRLATATREISEAIANYEFASYAQTLYRFIWDDFCDWYLESIKQTVGENPKQQATLATALRGAITLAHPIMPFITEVIWEQLASRLASLPAVDGVKFHTPRKGDLLCTAGWPEVAPGTEDASINQAFERLKGLITAIREVRAQHQVVPKRRITLHLPTAHAAAWADHAMLIQTLGGVEKIETAAAGAPADHGRVKFAFEGAEYAVSNLADAVDVGTERARLTKLIADKEKSIATMQARLANPGYAAKAPPHMVKQTQDQIAKDQADVDAAKATLASLPA